jgi:outer membrane protein assembly factor BamA
MPSTLPRIAALVLVLSAGAAAPASAQLFEDSARIADIEFAGAHAFEDELLRTAILTTERRCPQALLLLCWLGIGVEEEWVDPRVLGADAVRLRVFYYQRGFREAEVAVDTTRRDDGLDVLFRITEGRPVIVDSVAALGLDTMPPALLRNLPLRAAGRLDLIRYEATRDTLIARLRDRGYAGAEVLASYLIPRTAPHTASVEYELIPGALARFGRIVVEGAADVDSSIVRRMLTFRPGDAYSRRALLESQRNLFTLDVFRHAEIVQTQSADSVVDVTVRVIEGDLHRVRIGFGLSTADYLNAEARWASVDFFGRARRLDLRGRVSNLLTTPLDLIPLFEDVDGIYQQVAGALNADFRQPWFFGPRNNLGAGLFTERFILPKVFVRTGGGGYVSIARLLGANTSLTVGFRPELTKLESDGDLIFCVNFIACEQSDISVLREPHWLSPVSAIFARDRSNSLFAPTRGFRLRAETELAGRLTGSEFGYSRVLGEATAYRSVASGVVLATRLAAGAAWASPARDSAFTRRSASFQAARTASAASPSTCSGRAC